MFERLAIMTGRPKALRRAEQMVSRSTNRCASAASRSPPRHHKAARSLCSGPNNSAPGIANALQWCFPPRQDFFCPGPNNPGIAQINSTRHRFNTSSCPFLHSCKSSARRPEPHKAWWANCNVFSCQFHQAPTQHVFLTTP